MNDPLDPSPNHTPSPHKEVVVTLHLPRGLAKAIKQRAEQSGQSPTQAMLHVLQQAFLSGQDEPSDRSGMWLEDVKGLAARLSALETLADRVAALEQKFEQQLDQFPEVPGLDDMAWPHADADPLDASSDAASQPVDRLRAGHLDICPSCSSALGPPLKSSGRQVCIKCGWSNRPRAAIAEPAVDLPPIELQKLLDQAASEAVNNMKPKYKREAPKPPKRFPF